MKYLGLFSHGQPGMDRHGSRARAPYDDVAEHGGFFLPLNFAILPQNLLELNM